MPETIKWAKMIAAVARRTRSPHRSVLGLDGLRRGGFGGLQLKQPTNA